MVLIAKKSALTGTLTASEQAYVDYFGAYDQTRAQTVLDNFTVMALAFQRTPNVVDVRNTEYGKGCYAACFRNQMGSKHATTKVVSIAGSVEMFLGRIFFRSKTTADSVGTLIHEFAHGSFNAVDAPRVFAGAWELQPNHLTDPTHDDYGESPNNTLQSSTSDLDKALALKSPSIAIRNADNYCQFALVIIAAHAK